MGPSFHSFGNMFPPEPIDGNVADIAKYWALVRRRTRSSLLQQKHSEQIETSTISKGDCTHAASRPDIVELARDSHTATLRFFPLTASKCWPFLDKLLSSHWLGSADDANIQSMQSVWKEILRPTLFERQSASWDLVDVARTKLERCLTGQLPQCESPARESAQSWYDHHQWRLRWYVSAN